MITSLNKKLKIGHMITSLKKTQIGHMITSLKKKLKIGHMITSLKKNWK